MAKKMINATHVEGYVYEHRLEKRIAGPTSKNPGVQFINGILRVATDDDMLNVVDVHFTYVTETTAKGSPNATYTVLSAIVDGKIGSVMEHGKDYAGKVRIDSAIGLNEWYDNRTGEDTLISVKRNEGGFVHLTQELNDEKMRATFDTDMLITGVTRIEEDPDRELPERAILKGCIFNFRNDILPVEFTVMNPKAIDYFEGLNVSNKSPILTRVRGNQVSKTIVREIEEESAFGEPAVRTVRSSQRDFVINWALPEPYGWDTEESILASELSEAISNREVYLADMKRRNQEYRESRNNASAAASSTTTSTGGYDF